MKNILVATLLAFGFSAFAQEGGAPATPPAGEPAASAPAPKAETAKEKKMEKKAKHGKKKKDEAK